MGTLVGAAAGDILPPIALSALGIAIYGMFIAIFVPVAKKAKGVLAVVAISVALSCCLKYIPVFSGISQGFAIIICGIFASLLGAILFPVKQEKEAVADEG